jgi:hypothetical protein
MPSLDLTPDQLEIVERAVYHELQSLEQLCSAAAQKSFRLPSGRAVTSQELKHGFAMKDACRDTLLEIRKLAAPVEPATPKPLTDKAEREKGGTQPATSSAAPVERGGDK